MKVQGRRRLCKLSSKDDECQRSTLDETILDDEDGRHVRGTNDSSSSEIRDILKDLSSKLDSLTIEKKKGKGNDRGKDGSQFVDLSTPSPIAKRGKENEKVADAVEEPEYESALSSLSSGSSSWLQDENCVVLDDDGESHYDDTDSIAFVGQQKTYTLPGKVAKMLFPHQREGLKWLWDIHCKLGGGILGDDMGLGKTMQVNFHELETSLCLL